MGVTCGIFQFTNIEKCVPRISSRYGENIQNMTVVQNLS